MQPTLTITKAWQIYLPEKIREQLNIDHPGQMQAEVKNNQLILTPCESSFLKLAGSMQQYTPEENVDVDNIRDAIDYTDW